ncbi:MAG TPA: TIGR01777 family oxidoreductase [Candidatus Rubrimentiphilum sp.]|nr:TIGR01777 family oxidoreductase [Candidatus Rubrimentiphilum sp.]
MRVVIAGGSGQIGTILARNFVAHGADVTVLSRHLQPAPWKVVEWNGRDISGWAEAIEGAEVVIDLAGRSVDCRYTPANRREIMESRVLSTQAIGKAISRAARPPRVWLQASTATIYSHRYDALNDEITGILGGREPSTPDTWRFSIDVANAWEKACNESITPQTRKVLMRSAMVMSPARGGIFDALLGLVRRGLGGRAGDGRQYMSWVHDQDFLNAIDWLIARDDISGAVNIASPNPLPNAEFMRDIRHAAGVRVGLPINSAMLEVGAFLMRTETELILKSRRVVPRRLLDAGFRFVFPFWQQAANDLCKRAMLSVGAELH